MTQQQSLTHQPTLTTPASDRQPANAHCTHQMFGPRARPVESECEMATRHASSDECEDRTEFADAADDAGRDVDHAAGAHVEVTKLIDAAMKEVQRLVSQHNHCAAVPREHAAEFRRDLVQGTTDLMRSVVDHVAQELKDDDGMFAHMLANADAAAAGRRQSSRPSNKLHSGVRHG